MFQEKSETRETKYHAAKVLKASLKDQFVIEPWLKNKDIEIIKDHVSFYAVPQSFINDYAVIRVALNVQYYGVEIGQVIKEKLIPAHALALNNIIADDVLMNDLEYEEAILYLQKQELNMKPSQTGWQLVVYKNHPLGWINALPNRINNYYPKELRILKQRNNTPFEK